MRLLIAALLLLSPYAQAGMLRDFCERHLIADHPFPYAETDFQSLLIAYSRMHDFSVLSEILYRYRSGLLTIAETQMFWDYFR